MLLASESTPTPEISKEFLWLFNFSLLFAFPLLDSKRPSRLVLFSQCACCVQHHTSNTRPLEVEFQSQPLRKGPNLFKHSNSGDTSNQILWVTFRAHCLCAAVRSMSPAFMMAVTLAIASGSLQLQQHCPVRTKPSTSVFALHGSSLSHNNEASTVFPS